MAGSAKVTVAQTKTPAPAPAPNATVITMTAKKKKKKKSHFRRFWWLYLLTFIILVVVIVVPVIILVAVPKIAQEKLNKAKLSINSIAITNTQTGSLQMSILSTIEADNSVHATVDAFTGTLYYVPADSDTPVSFLTIDFPQTSSTSHQVINVTQEIAVQDLGVLTTFNKALVSSPSVSIQVKGDTHIRVRGIARSYPVTFEKTVSLKGLNNIGGTSISDPVIDALRSKGNFNATAHIPNPTILTLELGNTTFTNFLNGEDIGQVYINNLILRPGNNSFPLTADIRALPILNALTQEPLCELGGKLPFILSGKNVTNNGQEIPYFRDALAASHMNISVDLSEAAKEQGIPVRCLSLDL